MTSSPQDDLVTGYTDRLGHYEIQGLGDGEFLVHVDASHRGLVRTRTPIDIEKGAARIEIDFTLIRGAMISGKLVDVEGNDWQISSSHGRAQIKYGQDTGGSFVVTGFRSRYLLSDVRNSAGSSFLLGEGDYDRGNMFFPTQSTFVIQGMMPGPTLLNFSPQKEGQEVLEVIYNGQNIIETGLQTEPGQEIENVIIVVGGVQ